MVYPSKFKRLEAETGLPASETVLRLLNENPSIAQTARALKVSDAALLKFIANEKLSKVTVWVKAS